MWPSDFQAPFLGTGFQTFWPGPLGRNILYRDPEHIYMCIRVYACACMIYTNTKMEIIGFFLTKYHVYLPFVIYTLIFKILFCKMKKQKTLVIAHYIDYMTHTGIMTYSFLNIFVLILSKITVIYCRNKPTSFISIGRHHKI